MLKKSENKELYDLILADKDSNYYYFSEAHIQDLVQDRTDLKLADMDFMKTIVGTNCWYYQEGMKTRFWSPREYYDNHIWNTEIDIFSSDDDYITLIKGIFKAVPLNWNDLIKTENLPPDFPEDLRSVLLEPATMWDFMEAMLNLAQNFSEEQPKFKRLLQYLHGSVAILHVYQQIGIKGFNGTTFTDWNAFAESFCLLVYDRSTKKDLYSLFSEMHFAFDVYGIVKGRPRKQKFIGLLNDGKHTFYAGHAHILVTADVDMIAKSKLVYKIYGREMLVFTPDEFKAYLIQSSIDDTSVAALFSQFESASVLPVIYEEYQLDQIFIQKKLPYWFIGAFNTLNCASANGNTYFYFTQQIQNLPFNTLTVELERVVGHLVNHFGRDALGRGNLDRKELEEAKWEGREWRNGKMGILLYINSGIVLSFFKAAPPVEEETGVLPT